MTDKKKNELAKAPKGEVQLAYDYGADAGQGLDLTIDDLKIPFVSLMQGESKVLDPDEENYVAGGEAGMLFNAATKTFHKSLLLVPAFRKTTFVEWLPDRAGFVAEHDMNSEVVRTAKANAAKRNEYRHPDTGNELQETKSMFCIILDEDGETPVGYCVVPFTSTKMSPWRDYFTRLDTAKITKGAPLFANTLRIDSIKAERKGKKFYNYRLTPLRDNDGKLTEDQSAANVIKSLIAPDSAAYLAAKQLRDALESGRAEADRETVVDDQESTDKHF